MKHKERYCAYWYCSRNGGTTCWNWGGKFAGRACPQNDSCEHWRTCEMCNGVMGKCKKKIEIGRFSEFMNEQIQKLEKRVADLEKSQLQSMTIVKKYIEDQEYLSNKMHEMIEKLPEQLLKALNDGSLNK